MDVDEVAYRTAQHHNVTLQKAWLVACVGGVWAAYLDVRLGKEGLKQSKNTRLNYA